MNSRDWNYEVIEQLAYRFWQERGCPIGSPDEDWLRAEDELRRAESAVGPVVLVEIELTEEQSSSAAA